MKLPGLHYKIPAIILGVVENIAIVIMYIFLRSPDTNTKTIKHQQYIENILHEILLLVSLL